MPPKKSASSASLSAPPAAEDESVPGDETYSGKLAGESETLGIDYYDLPKSQIAKLAKSVLPPNVQVRKDVQTALIKSSTVFINYLAMAAEEKAQEQGVRTMTGENVLVAAQEIDMPHDMIRALQKQLKAFRALQQAKKASAKAARKASEGADDVEGQEAEKEGREQDEVLEPQTADADAEAADRFVPSAIQAAAQAGGEAGGNAQMEG